MHNEQGIESLLGKLEQFHFHTKTTNRTASLNIIDLTLFREFLGPSTGAFAEKSPILYLVTS